MTANAVKTSPSSTSSFSFASDSDFKQQNDGGMTGHGKSDGVEPIAIVGMGEIHHDMLNLCGGLLEKSRLTYADDSLSTSRRRQLAEPAVGYACSGTVWPM